MTNYLKIAGYLLALGTMSYVQIKIVSYVINEVEEESTNEIVSKNRVR